MFFFVLLAMQILPIVNGKYPAYISTSNVTMNNYEFCYANSEPINATYNPRKDRFTSCKHEKKIDERESACVLKLSNSKDNPLSNQACERCRWKERNSDKMCSNDGQENRDCCCVTPGCNKQLYMDALPGWSSFRLEESAKNSTNATVTCVHAAYNSSNKEKWSYGINLTESCASKICLLDWTAGNSSRITSLHMGCATDNDYCFNATANCNYMNTTEGVRTQCCCREPLCAAKDYRYFVFDLFLLERLEEEKKYLKMLKEGTKLLEKPLITKKKTHFKENIDLFAIGCIVIITIIFIVVVIFKKPMKREDKTILLEYQHLFD